MTLEERIKEACDKGLTHLTVWPVPSVDGKHTYWAARATPSTGHAYVSTQSKFAVDAIAEVLAQLPKAKSRQAPLPRFDTVNPPLSEMAQREVTAAVTEPLAVAKEELSHPIPPPVDEWSRFK